MTSTLLVDTRGTTSIVPKGLETDSSFTLSQNIDAFHGFYAVLTRRLFLTERDGILNHVGLMHLIQIDSNKGWCLHAQAQRGLKVCGGLYAALAIEAEVDTSAFRRRRYLRWMRSLRRQTCWEASHI